MPFLLPILALLGVGAAVYVATRPSAPVADAGAAALPEKQGLVNPQTGPQMLTRDQKIAFVKLLPSLIVDAGPSASTFDSGTLLPASQRAIAGDKVGPAIDILYRANMTGRAILVAKNGNTTAVMVPAIGTEATFAKASSSWFIALSPKEIDAIASAAGVVSPAAVSPGAIRNSQRYRRPVMCMKVPGRCGSQI